MSPSITAPSTPPSFLAATRARHRVASAPAQARGEKVPIPGNLGGWWYFLEPPVRRIQPSFFTIVGRMKNVPHPWVPQGWMQMWLLVQLLSVPKLSFVWPKSSGRAFSMKSSFMTARRFRQHVSKSGRSAGRRVDACHVARAFRQKVVSDPPVSCRRSHFCVTRSDGTSSDSCNTA